MICNAFVYLNIKKIIRKGKFIFTKDSYFVGNNQTEDQVKDCIRQAGKSFKYGQVNYSDFKATYNTDGWLGRKVTALPRAVWTLTVTTTINFTCLLFNALFSQNEDLKLDTFRAVRDLEEGFGWLVTMINDTWGAYYLQESTFHHTCYNIVDHIDNIENSPEILALKQKNKELIEKKQQELVEQQQKLETSKKIRRR